MVAFIRAFMHVGFDRIIADMQAHDIENRLKLIRTQNETKTIEMERYNFWWE